MNVQPPLNRRYWQSGRGLRNLAYRGGTKAGSGSFVILTGVFPGISELGKAAAEIQNGRTGKRNRHQCEPSKT